MFKSTDVQIGVFLCICGSLKIDTVGKSDEEMVVWKPLIKKRNGFGVLKRDDLDTTLDFLQLVDGARFSGL
jgi:hypothetical protein